MKQFTKKCFCVGAGSPWEGLKAVVFDYGNTLIEFGPRQVARQYAVLAKTLSRMFGTCDTEHLKTIRDRQIVAPFDNGYRENNLRTVCGELIREIYDLAPSESQIDELMQTRYDSFLHAIELPDDVLPLLRKLRRRYRLALLSNYPSRQFLLDSLSKIGLSDAFETVVISGDIGYVKPHPKPFQTLLKQLDLPPAQCVYVGDNWLADVQGSKRMGMPAILTTQYEPYEQFTPADGDRQPDARIKHINELEELLR